MVFLSYFDKKRFVIALLIISGIFLYGYNWGIFDWLDHRVGGTFITPVRLFVVFGLFWMAWVVNYRMR